MANPWETGTAQDWQVILMALQAIKARKTHAIRALTTESTEVNRDE